MIGRLVASHLRWLWASRGVLATLLLTAGAVLLAGLLALHDAGGRAGAAAAILWLVLGVGGLLAAGRMASAEHGSGGLRGLLLAPVPRRDLFLSRGLAFALVVLAMGLLAWVAVAAFFPRLPGAGDPRLVAPIAVGALGLGVLGALAGWASLSAGTSDLMAAVLAVPLSAPLVVGGLHATERILAARGGWEASLTFAAGYAVSMGALSYLVAEPVVEAP